MNTNPVFETLREVIANQLNVPTSKIREHTPLRPLFDECEASSLDMIDIALALEEKFEIVLHVDELESWKNPQDALAYISAAPKVAAVEISTATSQQPSAFPVNF